jgi:hypothetical protein
MNDLPSAIIFIMSYFAPIFSRPIFQRICLLFKAHILSNGRRTVCDLLRCLGLENEKKFSKFHRVFYGAVWSGLEASRILFQLIIKFFPSSEIIVVIDSHVERRKGPCIKGVGIQRDAVHSTKNRKVLVPGLNWLISAVSVKLPWTSKRWALPFLSIMMPPKVPLSSSKRKNDEKTRKHKKLTEWTCQISNLLRRWVGKCFPITIVADSAFACYLVCLRCIKNRIGFISRLRMDARLHEFPDPSNPEKRGRKRVKGKRLANPAEIAKDPNTVWTKMLVGWYGGLEKEVLVYNLDCIWNAGHKIVPIRMVLIKSSPNAEAIALFSTDFNHTSEFIIETYIGRWPIEVTFEESRRHLGVETQRQWCDNSIARETPSIFASFSLITLIALKIKSEKEISVKQASWYKKREATFSDIFMCVKESILRQEFLSCRIKGRHERKMLEKWLSRLAAA